VEGLHEYKHGDSRGSVSLHHLLAQVVASESSSQPACQVHLPEPTDCRAPEEPLEGLGMPGGGAPGAGKGGNSDREEVAMYTGRLCNAPQEGFDPTMASTWVMALHQATHLLGLHGHHFYIDLHMLW
jgi:hypothetical protein